ncbi:MAG: DUF4921 family protein [Actinobacteria bacterium]|nr:DUF4921 family protein [Actinomycetota bacterium]MCG2801330.1 DUF4921 family protein [Cellulomonas sp.]
MTEPLVRLADGTVKQVSPLTGTTVWTVPGRGARPLTVPDRERRPVVGGGADRLCVFCWDRMAETTPEKSRLVVDAGGAVRTVHDVPASRLGAEVPELRSFGNLFEIVSQRYWRTNHGTVTPARVHQRARDYVSEPAGRAQVEALLAARAGAAGGEPASPGSPRWWQDVEDLFDGSHDVVVARRHLVDGARFTDELAGPGTLDVTEHRRFIAFTVAGLRRVYRDQPAARYVAVFQNWLRAAGASQDHLHKQLVAIDEDGPQLARELVLARSDPALYQHAVLDLAVRHHLVVARNEHAVVVAGIGHRYPSLEVYSTAPAQLPWEHTPAQVDAFADLLHAVHAATGPQVPSNEEWHHRPPGADQPMPWRAVIKWRVSTLAGFEGGTRINVNTIDPWQVADRVVQRLVELRAAGLVAPMAIGDQCEDLVLRYGQEAAR